MGEQPSIFDDPAALIEALPWVGSLDAADRAAFAAEAAECARTGDGAALAELLEDWRGTAEYLADPAVARTVTREVDAPVEEPTRH